MLVRPLTTCAQASMTASQGPWVKSGDCTSPDVLCISALCLWPCSAPPLVISADAGLPDGGPSATSSPSSTWFPTYISCFFYLMQSPCFAAWFQTGHMLCHERLKTAGRLLTRLWPSSTASSAARVSMRHSSSVVSVSDLVAKTSAKVGCRPVLLGKQGQHQGQG